MRRGVVYGPGRFGRDGCTGCREEQRRGGSICRACEEEAEAIAEARR